jgi:hypothetical protein
MSSTPPDDTQGTPDDAPETPETPQYFNSISDGDPSLLPPAWRWPTHLTTPPSSSYVRIVRPPNPVRDLWEQFSYA